jgi:hypothetical protein
MKKSDLARKIWFRNTAIENHKLVFSNEISLTKVKRVFRVYKYYYYLMMFKLALVEFKLNLLLGKITIFFFNLINAHKIRVNRIVNERSQAVSDSQK